MTRLPIQLLQNMPIFGAIRDDILQYLLEQAKVVKVASGDCFFMQGDHGDSLFVLESGSATAIRRWQDRELSLGEFATGDCFGEISLMDLHPRSATVRAEEDSIAYEITHGDLYHLYGRDPEQFAMIQMNISREVCRRLRAAGDLLFRIGMGEEIDNPDITLEISWQGL